MRWTGFSNPAHAASTGLLSGVAGGLEDHLLIHEALVALLRNSH